MDVDDPLREPLQERLGQQMHVAREHDELHAVLVQPLRHGRVARLPALEVRELERRRRHVDAFPDAVVNVHPSLLPSFPGAHAVEEQLAAGVPESGATVHLVDEGVDSGPILAQERVPVLPGDTAETLHERIKSVEHRLLPKVVGELCAR